MHRKSIYFGATMRLPCDQCGGPAVRGITDRSADLRHAYCSMACYQAAPRQRRSIADRFWPRVEKSPTCWLATGAHNARGYRVMAVPRIGGGWRNAIMSQVAWWLATGEWPIKGQFVCHACPDGDTPACVRNDDVGTYSVRGIEYQRRGHLWLGTPTANHQDMQDKGRQRSGDEHPARIDPSYLARGDNHPARANPGYLPRGERNGSAKYTAEMIRWIRAEHATGRSQISIAVECGRSKAFVSKVIRRETWMHLD